MSGRPTCLATVNSLADLRYGSFAERYGIASSCPLSAIGGSASHVARRFSQLLLRQPGLALAFDSWFSIGGVLEWLRQHEPSNGEIRLHSHDLTGLGLRLFALPRLGMTGRQAGAVMPSA
jgi:hypothetical protein